MKQIPEFFYADRLTPIAFYGYTSSVTDRIYEVDADDASERLAVERFNDLKRKCMGMCVDMRKDGDEEPLWSKDIWDGKIVIECQKEDGSIIYVGYWDFTYSIGLSVECRTGRRRPYKPIQLPDEITS